MKCYHCEKINLLITKKQRGYQPPDLCWTWHQDIFNYHDDLAGGVIPYHICQITATYLKIWYMQISSLYPWVPFY